MDIETLREFICLGNTLSFTVAASQCYITQSALSKHIASLETAVGANLFIRGRQRIRLTPIGTAFFSEAQEIVSKFDAAMEKIERLKHEVRGVLRIGYLYGATRAFLPHVNGAFHLSHPDIEVQLCSLEGMEIMRALEQDGVDLVITNCYKPISQDWFNYYKVYDDYYGVFVSKAHELAKKKTIEIQDLSGMQLVIPSKVRFRDQYEGIIQAIRKRLESDKTLDITIKDNIYDIMDLASFQEQPECAVLTISHLADLFEQRDACFIPMINPYLKVDVCAIWKKMREDDSILDFIEEIKQVTEPMGTECLRNRIGSLSNQFSQ